MHDDRPNEKQPALAGAAVSLDADVKTEHPDSIMARPGAQGPNVETVDRQVRWESLKLTIERLAKRGYSIVRQSAPRGMCCLQARAGRAVIADIVRPNHLYIQAVEAAVVECQQDAKRRLGTDKAA